ncbi:MAG: L,D-transpeptidase [Deltaproteobacteria bacterium]|nr:L,D-transpeptidase [Deltaproteobacteria bacterium]
MVLKSEKGLNIKRKSGVNRRVNTKNSKSGSVKSSNKFHGALLTAVVITFGALGVWQCFDGDENKDTEVLTSEKISKIDAGNKKVDPTVVNESQLLQNETKAPKKVVEAEKKTVVEDANTIKDAGEKITADSDQDAINDMEEKYPLYAVAFHFHSQIKEEADSDATVLAYARRGSTFRVSNRVSKKGCAKGWHEVYGGGHLCDGTGFNVSSKPITFEPSPPPADMNSPMPYKYMYSKRDSVPEYWKLPDSDEVKITNEVFDRINQRDSASVPALVTEKNTIQVGSEAKYDNAALNKALDKALSAEHENEIDTGQTKFDSDNKTDSPVDDNAPDIKAVVAAVKSKIDSDSSDFEDPFALPPFVHLKMAKGYYVSTSSSIENDGKKYVKTIRGRYIPAEDLYPAKPSTFEGVLLGDDIQLPLIFIVNGGTKVLLQKKEDGALENGEKVERYSHFKNLGTMKRRGRTYIKIGNGKYISSNAAAAVNLREPPEGLEENERWIDVDLTNQVLVAYEGKVPVFATLVSTGKHGHETPVGEFKIYNKHVAITMDDPEGGDEAYSIEDVPWTQYFKDGYALHAAFWHDRFGKVRSHGCINLSPGDARRLFFWTGPLVAPSYHGVIATPFNPGTKVIIHL